MHSEVKNGSALSKGEKVGTVKKQKAGKLEEKFQALTQEGARGSSGVGVALPAENADASRDRRPLESYFQEIGSTRTLKREEEVFLAKELEEICFACQLFVQEWHVNIIAQLRVLGIPINERGAVSKAD